MHADHDAHAPAHAPAAAAPDFGAWLGGTLLFMAALGAVFLVPGRHGAGHNSAPVAAAHAGGAHGHGSEAPAATKLSDEQRLAEVLSAIGSGAEPAGGKAEIVAATGDIQFLIHLVATSKLSYKLNDEPKTAVDVAEVMLERFRNAAEPFYSGYIYIRRVAGYTQPQKLMNRVILADGTDKSLADWLREHLEVRHGQEPTIFPTPMRSTPRAGQKKQKKNEAPPAESQPADPK